MGGAKESQGDGCPVHTARSGSGFPVDAKAACDRAGEGCVRLAFVNLDARRFQKTDLARALVARGTNVVFAGGFSEPEGSEILVLDRPFSAETTAALLQRAERLKSA